MSKQDHVKVQDELDILTNEIEQSFMQQNGWSRCRYMLSTLIAKKDIEIKRLQAEFTGELTQSPLEMIRAKCEQYWNEFTTPCPEEWHVILEFIHKLTRSAENDIEKLKQKQIKIESIRNELLRQARLYQLDNGDPGPLSSEWGWRDISRYLRKAAKIVEE